MYIFSKKLIKYFILFSTVICTVQAIIEDEEIDLSKYELRRISQFGEDGVLEKIFQLIGTTSKYYVEFGAGDGHFCSNVKYLRERYEWTGLLLDGACSNDMGNDRAINLYKEFITVENICDLFKKYNVPNEFDLISIDIDRNDFYVWKALSKNYKPRVVVIEFNSGFNFNDDKVIKYSAKEVWDGTDCFGASMLSLFNLGKILGYSLVYQESCGVNIFFIRDDIIEDNKLKFKNVNDVSRIYNAVPRSLNEKIVSKNFISSLEALK